MSVLECDRRDCENVMCDYYSDTYGYLCWECLSELKSKTGSTSIGDFMYSRKGSPTTNSFYCDEIEDEFKSRFEGDTE